jgi:hypothetical protein
VFPRVAPCIDDTPGIFIPTCGIRSQFPAELAQVERRVS